MTINSRRTPKIVFLAALQLALAMAVGGMDCRAEDTVPNGEGAAAGPIEHAEPYKAVRNLYELAESPRKGDAAVCKAFLDAANIPKPYYPSRLPEFLLGTDFNYLWKIYSDSDKDWRYPRTVEEALAARYTELEVDLDGDQSVDYLYRSTLEFQFQPYSRVIVLDTPAESARDPRLRLWDGVERWSEKNRYELLTRVTSPPGVMGIDSGISDFYAIDVVRIMDRNYVVAATSVTPHSELRLLDTFLISVKPRLKLEKLCHFRTKYLLP